MSFSWCSSESFEVTQLWFALLLAPIQNYSAIAQSDTARGPIIYQRIDNPADISALGSNILLARPINLSESAPDRGVVDRFPNIRLQPFTWSVIEFHAAVCALT